MNENAYQELLNSSKNAYNAKMQAEKEAEKKEDNKQKPEAQARIAQLRTAGILPA